MHWFQSRRQKCTSYRITRIAGCWKMCGVEVSNRSLENRTSRRIPPGNLHCTRCRHVPHDTHGKFKAGSQACRLSGPFKVRPFPGDQKSASLFFPGLGTHTWGERGTAGALEGLRVIGGSSCRPCRMIVVSPTRSRDRDMETTATHVRVHPG